MKKQRFQFAVLLRKPEMRKQLKTRLERFATVFAVRAISGHTENYWLKTPRYAAKLKPEDFQWMSVLSHNTYMCNLDSILTTGLVPGGYLKGSHDVQISPTCRFSNPNYGIGRADREHNAVVVLNKSRTCKTSELYQAANCVIVSPKIIEPQNIERAWVRMKVPRFLSVTDTWCWEQAWCTAYDERLVGLPITGYILVPNKQRYIDPDFEADLKEAVTTGVDWSVICTRRALQLGLAGRPVRHCPACGRLHVAGKAFCWVYSCSAFYLFNGVGKSVICDSYIRDTIAQARAKAARVSGYVPSLATASPAAPAVEQARGSGYTAAAGTPLDEETLKEDAMKRYTKLCRIITHGITSSGSSTPRAALIAAIREQYKFRIRWRANRTRLPDESGDGDGKLSLQVIKEMAREGRCPVWNKLGVL